MNKTKRLLLPLLSLTLVGLSGCTSASHGEDGLSIYASFFPLYDFASRIAGNKASVTCLTPAGNEPHDYELTVDDAKGLSDCDLFLLNGLGLEPYEDSLPSGIDKKAFLCNEGIKTITSSTGLDPHIWLSIPNAIKMMENIEGKLEAIDPSNASYYQANLEKQSLLFASMDEKIASETSSFSNKNIVVAHQAFSYYCNDYGLNQISISGLSPEEEPTPSKIAEIISAVNTYKVTTIFYEEYASPEVAEMIAKQTGCKTAVLSPIESSSDSSDDYLSLQAANLLALKEACL